MKLVTIDSREVTGRPGVLTDDESILDLIAAPSGLAEAQWLPQSVVSILAAGEQGLEHLRQRLAAVTHAGEEIRQAFRRTGVLLPLKGTALLAPIRRPGLILICGHVELGGRERVQVAIIKGPNSVVGDAARVAVPWASTSELTGEALLGVVLGRPIYQSDRDTAQEAIVGFTLLADLSLPAPDDGSAASWQAYIESRQFPGSCPMGPAIVTSDEMVHLPDLRLSTFVNGMKVGMLPAISADLDIARAVAELSNRYGFRPGDVIAFRSGPGADVPRLRDKDRVAVSLNGLMKLQFEVTFS
jgi:2-keto-4-pentenoate hydratase/2-oxohepta-3-ene-1,7-dioic acid hydratase in catechol pathway